MKNLGVKVIIFWKVDLKKDLIVLKMLFKQLDY